MLEAVARIAPSQPNEAMARIAPHKYGTISLDPSCRVENSRARFFELDTKVFSMGKYIQKEDWARLFQKRGSSLPPPPPQEL
jgi:hypothetical protein